MMHAELGAALRFAREFGRFLRVTPDLADCRRLIAEGIAGREAAFLGLVRDSFADTGSPYRALLDRAKIKPDDVAAWLGRHGVEGALAELYDAGVFVALDEFKGRRPIRRPGLELRVTPRAFDNPRLTASYAGWSGGTRGAGTRSLVGLQLVAQESASDAVFLAAVGGLGRPLAVWRPALPPGAGLKVLLRAARLGTRVDRWFSQTPVGWSRASLGQWLLLRYVIAAARWRGRRLPWPEHLPVHEAAVAARWLAAHARAGRPACLDANVGSAVRVAMAAAEHGLDISGTLVRVGSEPLTDSRAHTIRQAGVRVFGHYHLAEAGRLAVACAAPAHADEVHVCLDKVALLQRERVVGAERVGALYCTTILPSSPKLMLNVELGDHGVLGERACGCPFESLGLVQHLHRVRSYEKLTTEGMHFVGADLVRLVEDVLPARFGGHPTDYQLVEDDRDGVARVTLVVSPRVGPLDDAQVVAAALEVLASPPGGGSGEAMMAAYWRQAGTLSVVRAEPHLSPAAKILPLHVIRAAAPHGSGIIAGGPER